MKKKTAQKHKRARAMFHAERVKTLNEFKNLAFSKKIEFVRTERQIRTYNAVHFIDSKMNYLEDYEAKQMIARHMVTQLLNDGMIEFIYVDNMPSYANNYFMPMTEINARLQVVVPENAERNRLIPRNSIEY